MRKLVVSALCLGVCLSCFLPMTYAEPVDSVEGEIVETVTPITLPALCDVKEKEIVTTGEDGTENTDTLFVFSTSGGEDEILVEGSGPYNQLMSEIKSSISEDVSKGLSALDHATVTLDHIRLDVWGEFLNKYYGKSITNFPSGTMDFDFGPYDFSLTNSTPARNFIRNEIIPILIEEIESQVVNYPVKRYALDIPEGSLLKDYEFDVTQVREIKTVYPLDNVETYVFYNTGSYYGLALSQEYVDILRGYLEGDKGGYDRRVEGSVPGCVNVLSYITLLRRVTDYTLSDKVLGDFMIYNNLAIALDTKKLVDTTDMTTENKELLFSDFKLDETKLVLAPISDTVVVIQPTYLECVYYMDLNRGLYRTIDTTKFISEGVDYFEVTDDKGNVSQVPIAYFSDSEGQLSVQLGQAPFLMYYSSHVPYDRILHWAFNYAAKENFSQDVIDNVVKTVKSEMKEQGRLGEYNAYLKAEGQMTDTTKLIIFGAIAVVLIAAGITIFVIIKKKKQNSPLNDIKPNDLLFNDMDSDYDDEDDDDDGSFELK